MENSHHEKCHLDALSRPSAFVFRTVASEPHDHGKTAKHQDTPPYTLLTNEQFQAKVSRSEASSDETSTEPAAWIESDHLHRISHHFNTLRNTAVTLLFGAAPGLSQREQEEASSHCRRHLHARYGCDLCTGDAESRIGIIVSVL